METVSLLQGNARWSLRAGRWDPGSSKWQGPERAGLMSGARAPHCLIPQRLLCDLAGVGVGVPQTAEGGGAPQLGGRVVLLGSWTQADTGRQVHGGPASGYSVGTLTPNPAAPSSTCAHGGAAVLARSHGSFC